MTSKTAFASALEREILADPELKAYFRRAVEHDQEEARRFLHSDRTPLSFDIFSGAIKTRVEESAAASAGRDSRACCKGCAFCCYLRVIVSPIEAMAIARYLRRTRNADELAAIREKLLANVLKLKRISAAEHDRTNVRCAFLQEDNTCGVYEVRPTNCVAYTSSSVGLCEKAYNEPATETNIPSELMPLVYNYGASTGRAVALKQDGVDSNGYELSSAVLRALDEPDALSRWLKGDDVFGGCIRDNHKPTAKKWGKKPKRQ